MLWALPFGMPIRWDAPLVRHLARELDARLSGERLRALRLDGDARDLVLIFGDLTLLWRLHPSRGYPLILPARDVVAGDLRMASKVRSVHAPEDERIVTFELLPARRSNVDLIVELLGNQWNAAIVEREGSVIRHVLHVRKGRRPLRVGAVYAPPTPSLRDGGGAPLGEDRWRALLERADALPPERRARFVVSEVAWTSHLNVAAILDASGDADGEAASYALLARLADPAASPEPVLLDTELGPQPYPFPLPGVPSRPAESLLDAFAEAARAGGSDDAGAALLPPELLRELERTVDGAARRVTSLEAELGGAEDPAELRVIGDLILARYAEIKAGADEVVLDGFDGDQVCISLDPAKAVHENADAYYDRAARAERARARLPELIEAARAHAARLDELLTLAGAGAADAADIRAALRWPAAPEASPSDGPPLPYRRYRSSGGLEIRVGKGSRHNDELTFRHSSPDDVWLHARHAAGAHVVLRWPGPGNPPARDLEEAAVLAAVHSKARTSGSVPVDWTLRKHVRKPRRALPGTVLPDRVKTLFVEPDTQLAEALRESGG